MWSEETISMYHIIWHNGWSQIGHVPQIGFIIGQPLPPTEDAMLKYIRFAIDHLIEQMEIQSKTDIIITISIYRLL